MRIAWFSFLLCLSTFLSRGGGLGLSSAGGTLIMGFIATLLGFLLNLIVSPHLIDLMRERAFLMRMEGW